MKIFLISRGYPSAKSPQWGCFEKDQAEALATLGHKVVMISYDGRFRMYWRRLGIERKEANGVVSLNAFFLPSKVVGLLGRRGRRCFEEWQLRLVYERAVKLFGEPDVLYSHYLFLSNIALTLKRHYDKPLVAIEHWSVINEPTLPAYVKSIGKETYGEVDAIVSVANTLRESILRHFDKESFVVHNMVGTEFYFKPSSPSYKLRIVSTGSLIKRKGFDLLVDALGEMKDCKNKWQVTILGEGEERSELQSKIDSLELSENIILAGKKNKKEIVEYLQDSDVFVLPSRNENFSVAVLEALACGLPVVASICGGIRECIDEKNGLLFPVDDKDALVRSLRHMIDNREAYNHEEIARDCMEQFSPSVIAKCLTDVFESVLGGK